MPKTGFHSEYIETMSIKFNQSLLIKEFDNRLNALIKMLFRRNDCQSQCETEHVGLMCIGSTSVVVA